MQSAKCKVQSEGSCNCGTSSRLSRYVALFSLHLALCTAVSGTLAQRPTSRPPAPSYSRDVVPILRTACIGCHGEQNPPGGISLTSYMTLMKGGKSGPAVVPGKGAASRIVRMMLGTLQPKMPPGGGGLKQADIDKIRAWIDAGAKV